MWEGSHMWFGLFALVAPSALAETFDYVELKPTPIPEARIVNRYGDYFDDVLMRRFGRSAMSGESNIGGGDAQNLLGSAAAEAAADWSVWVLRRVPMPTVRFSLPRLKKSRASIAAADGEPGLGGRIAEVAVRPDAVMPVPPRQTTPWEPSLRMAVLPRVTSTPEGGQGVDAVVQATATGLGPSAWRLSSNPITKTWSVWLKQDLTPSVALVASTDSTRKKPDPAGFGGGALFKIPGGNLRIYTRYEHGLPKVEREREHLVAVNLSVAPSKKKHR